MTHRLPPCDHDECGPVNCKRSGLLAPAPCAAIRPHVQVRHCQNHNEIADLQKHQFMQSELTELAALLSGKTTPQTIRDLGYQIVVVDRGFVYVGAVTIEGDMCRIHAAKNIRKWGTTKGLGELVDGPTKDTVIDNYGEVLVPMQAVIHFIKTNIVW